MAEPCADCNGIGGTERARFHDDPDPQWRNCSTCKGSGEAPKQPEETP
jgi:DnaJ-class molecular chaperone